MQEGGGGPDLWPAQGGNYLELLCELKGGHQGIGYSSLIPRLKHSMESKSLRSIMEQACCSADQVEGQVVLEIVSCSLIFFLQTHEKHRVQTENISIKGRGECKVLTCQ